MFKTLIVDDEAPAREKLRRYLSEEADFKVIGEAEDGSRALELLESEKPDLLLLDIQMPGMNGFDVLRLLPADQMPAVIFATAYDEYAVDAFEVSAADYLLKPFGQARFRKALKKVTGSNRSESNIPAVLSQLQNPCYATRLAVRHLRRIKILDVSQINRVLSEQQVIAVYDRDGTRYWTEETLENLNKRLDPAHFFRIHRSAIVNLDSDFEIEPWHDGRLRMHFGDDLVLTVARGPAKELRGRLGF